MQTAETESKKDSKNIDTNNPEFILKSLGEYNKELSKELPKSLFKKDPYRLKYAVLFYVGIVAIVYSFLAYSLPDSG